jgi:drug/metabolite transporter (DMT)-like permease
MASAVLVSVGNVLSAQLMNSKLSWVYVNAFGMAVGSIAALLWGTFSGGDWTLEITTSWLQGYGYLVIVGSVLAFGIYMQILPIVGTTAGAYVTVLCPVVALGISVVLEGLSLQFTTVAGALLLLLGHSVLVRQKA